MSFYIISIEKNVGQIVVYSQANFFWDLLILTKNLVLDVILVSIMQWFFTKNKDIGSMHQWNIVYGQKSLDLPN